jgi:AcrR family transcriptional regulator
MRDIQRIQILEATAALVAEQGVADLTLAGLISRAKVSRRAFYERFEDRDSCLVAAFDLGVERLTARARPAYEAEQRWRDAIRAGLAEALRYLDEEPALARLLVVHSLSGSSELLRRRAEVQGELFKVIDAGRAERASRRSEPPPIVAEGVVGAMLAVVYTRLLAQGADPPDERPVIELFGALMSLVVLPYMGPSAAQRELLRPAPVPRELEPSLRPALPSLEDYGVRLTYRTGRVLSAIAQYPGASNREIAERAGIVDQGQVSKLLARLQRAGVIANLGRGALRGAPNAWTLTERGQRVQHDLEERFSRFPRASTLDREAD